MDKRTLTLEQYLSNRERQYKRDIVKELADREVFDNKMSFKRMHIDNLMRKKGKRNELSLSLSGSKTEGN